MSALKRCTDTFLEGMQEKGDSLMSWCLTLGVIQVVNRAEIGFMYLIRVVNYQGLSIDVNHLFLLLIEMTQVQ